MVEVHRHGEMEAKKNGALNNTERRQKSWWNPEA
jgi:hypothetical protein